MEMKTLGRSPDGGDDGLGGVAVALLGDVRGSEGEEENVLVPFPLFPGRDDERSYDVNELKKRPWLFFRKFRVGEKKSERDWWGI